MTAKSHRDHGWAWVITVTVLCTNLLAVGYLAAFGVFFVEIVDTFQTTSSLASMIMAVKNGAYCFFALLVHNVLLEVIEVRTCVLIGSVVMAGGIMVATFANTVPLLILTMGGCVGAGHACVYGPGIVLLGQYFNRRRALANALASMGSSLGGMTLPLLATTLLQQYGLRGGLLVYGAVTLHIAVFASFYRPPPKGGGTDNTSKEEIAEDSHEPLLVEKQQVGTAGSGDVESCNVHGGDDVGEVFEGKSKEIIAKGELEGGEKTPYGNGGDPRFNGWLTVVTEGQKFSSTGNVSSWTEHPHLFLQPKRSHTLGDLRGGFPGAPVTREAVHLSLGSQLLRQLRNHALHLSRPRDLGDMAAGDETLHNLRAHDEKDTKEVSSDVSSDSGKSSGWCLRRLCGSLSCDPTLFRSPAFWLVQAYVCVGVVGATVGSAYLPALVQEKGLKMRDAAWTMTIWGACNLVGRLLCGLLADRKVLRPARISALTLTVTGLIFTTVSVVPPSRAAWGVFAAVYGLMEGGYFSMLPDIVVDLVGVDSFSRTFGFAMISQGIFAAAMFPILGGLRDVTGNYHCTYYMIGALAVLAACLLLSDLAVWLRRAVRHLW